MSIKVLLLIAILGAGIFVVSRAEPPRPASVAAGDSTTYAQVTFSERFKYSVGSVGSAIVGTSVRRSVLETEQSLKDLRKAIKLAKGGDGIRANDIAKKITYMDSLAVDNLHQGRPIKAMKQSMEAKNLLNAVRHNLN